MAANPNRDFMAFDVRSDSDDEEQKQKKRK